MIILEGPDGSGKTTLLHQLHQVVDADLHPRASDSVEGPVQNIFKWAHEDIKTMSRQPFSIYDRHPLISEPIYGKIVRNFVDPRFYEVGMVNRMQRYFGRECLVVLCLPPRAIVKENLGAELQMPGVGENIDAIYDEYEKYVKDPLNSTRASVFWYDYTRPGDWDKLYNVAWGHRIMWDKRRGNHEQRHA